MQSAGILVVRPLPANSDSTVERIVDIRVDDHEQPFRELRRLLQMTTGVPNRLTERSAQLAKEGKFAEAIAEQKKALEINPRNEPAMYALAQRYAQAGDTKQALEHLAHAIRRQPKQWKAQAATDPMFAKLAALPEFKKLVARRGRRRGLTPIFTKWWIGVSLKSPSSKKRSQIRTLWVPTTDPGAPFG